MPSLPFLSSFLPAVLLFHHLAYLVGKLAPFQGDLSVFPSHFSVDHTGVEPREKYFMKLKLKKQTNYGLR